MPLTLLVDGDQLTNVAAIASSDGPRTVVFCNPTAASSPRISGAICQKVPQDTVVCDATPEAVDLEILRWRQAPLDRLAGVGCEILSKDEGLSDAFRSHFVPNAPAVPVPVPSGMRDYQIGAGIAAIGALDQLGGDAVTTLLQQAGVSKPPWWLLYARCVRCSPAMALVFPPGLPRDAEDTRRRKIAMALFAGRPLAANTPLTQIPVRPPTWNNATQVTPTSVMRGLLQLQEAGGSSYDWRFLERHCPAAMRALLAARQPPAPSVVKEAEKALSVVAGNPPPPLPLPACWMGWRYFDGDRYRELLLSCKRLDYDAYPSVESCDAGGARRCELPFRGLLEGWLLQNAIFRLPVGHIHLPSLNTLVARVILRDQWLVPIRADGFWRFVPAFGRPGDEVSPARRPHWFDLGEHPTVPELGVLRIGSFRGQDAPLACLGVVLDEGTRNALKAANEPGQPPRLRIKNVIHPLIYELV